MLIDPTEVIGLYTTSQEAVMAEKLITNFGFVKLSSSSKIEVLLVLFGLNTLKNKSIT